MIHPRHLALATLAASLVALSARADQAAGDPAAQALALSKQTGMPIVAVAGSKT